MKRLVVLVLLILPVLMMAYQVKNGDVSGQTWNAGTYYIDGNLSVSEGSTLVLMPGAILKFGYGISLNCEGSLNAVSEGDSIYYTSMHDDSVGEVISGSFGNPAGAGWYGIRVTGAQATANMQRNSIRYSINNYGLYFDILQDNGSYAIVFYYCNVNNIVGNSFSGNMYDTVQYYQCTILGSVQFSNAQRVVLNQLYIPEGQSLTIAAGTLIKFIGGNITVYGELNLLGDQQSPVVITSYKDDTQEGDWNADGAASMPAAGDWGGIVYQSLSHAPQIQHLRMFYGSGISLYCTYRGTISNNVFAHNNGNAIYLQSFPHDLTNNMIISTIGNGINLYGVSSETPYLIEDNFIGQSSEYPVLTSYSTVYPMSANMYVENRINAPCFNYSTLVGDHQWGSGNVAVINHLTIAESSSLDLAPGAVVKFMAGPLTVNGTLVCAGNEVQQIFFTSFRDDSIGGDLNADGEDSVPQPGDWGNIIYNDTAGAPQLSYVVVRYGGIQVYTANRGNINHISVRYAGNTGITLQYHPHDIQDSDLSYNLGDGIGLYYVSSEDVYTISGNQLNNNGQYAINSHYSVLYPLQNNTIQNNYFNAVYLVFSTLSGYHQINPGQQYLIYAATVPVGSTLDVQVGSVVKFFSGSLEISGTLLTNGSAVAPIVFTSYRDDVHGGDLNADGSQSSPDRGDWGGLRFGDTAAAPAMNYVYVYYGSTSFINTSASGYLRYCKFNYSSGNGLQIQYAAHNVDYCEFSYNSGSGLAMSYLSTTQAYNVRFNHFNSNDAYPLIFTYSNVFSLVNNSYHSNRHNALAYMYCSVPSNMYVVEGSVIAVQNLVVQSGVTFTVYPGTIFKFLGSDIVVNGRIVAQGTSTNPIIFTSWLDDSHAGDTNADGNASAPYPGSWTGVTINGDYSISNLQYCHILYGRGLTLNSTHQSTISRCKIQYSSEHGISLYTPQNISDCDISRNLGHGVAAFSEISTFRRCYIQFNQGYGIYIVGTPLNLGTSASHGRNFIRYNNSNGYQVYSTSSSLVPTIGNFWQWDTAAEIDQHIWDNDENPNSGEVSFGSWYYMSLETPVVWIETQNDTAFLRWDWVLDKLGNPALIQHYRVEYCSNPYASEPVWTELGQSQSNDYQLNDGLLPDAVFFRVVAVEVTE